MYNSYGNALSSNHCAAVSFYGNPFSSAQSSGGGSGNGSGTGNVGGAGNGTNETLVKALIALGKTINTTNNINRNDKLINNYNIEKTSAQNTLSLLGNIKSKLADLSTKALRLKDLQETINFDLSGTNSSSLLSNSKLSLSNSIASITSNSGNLLNGLYNVGVEWAEGSSESKLASTNGYLSNLAITKTDLLNTKLSHIKGYTGLSSDSEIITITNGINSVTVTITQDTTVSDFISEINNTGLGIEAIYDSTNGKISLSVIGYTNEFSMSSTCTNGGSALNILGLDNLTSVSETRDIYAGALTLNRPTTFGDIGYDGTISYGGYANNINAEIQADATYGTIISGYRQESGSIKDRSVTFQYNEDNLVIKTNNYRAISSGLNNTTYRTVYTSYNTYGIKPYSLKAAYDISNLEVIGRLNVDDLDTVFYSNSGSTGYQAALNQPEHTTTYDSSTTNKDVLLELGLITEDDIENSQDGYIEVDLSNIYSMDVMILGIFDEFVVTAQAKTDENAPIELYDDATTQTTDKLVNLSNGEALITTGTFVLTDGDNTSTFEIDETTTLADFNSFLSTNGVSLNPDGSYNFGLKRISGTSNLVDAFDVELVVQDTFEATGDDIMPTETGTLKKNLAAFGLAQSSNILINNTSIELDSNDSIEKLISKINNANAGVAASFNATNGQITLVSDNKFKAIDIRSGSSGEAVTFLQNLGLVDANGDTISQQGHSVVVTVNNNGVTTSETIEADTNGNLVFNYSQVNDSKTATARFNITDLGEFTFGVSNGNQNVISTNANVAQVLSYSDNIEENIYTINVDKNVANVIDKNGNTSIYNLEPSEDGNTYLTIEQDNGESLTLQIKNSGITSLNIPSQNNNAIDSETLSAVVGSVNTSAKQNNISYVRDFVDTYNSVLKDINNLDKKEYKEFYNLINQIKTSISSSDGQNSTDFGLNMKYDSINQYTNLMLDETELLNDLENNFENLTAYLTSMSDSVTSQIDTFISGSKLQNSYNKTLDKIEKYDETISKIKTQNEQLMNDYDKEYKVFQQILEEYITQYLGTSYPQ